ncbi:hypothetical protein [Agrobacterium deltaense]|uniref:hypothetical protein n=1 Tax=Agrobacterium deltaense TaxID=1183412 RepID=UPI000F64483A|nr:hypothetical protein [Agrobacterium deltaense]RRN67659.1 hypothetical protein EIQ31_22495 [Agrobacterium deltaense]
MPHGTDELEKAIAIALAVVAGTFRNGFGGTGVRRRREPGATKEVAFVITRYLGHTYSFYDADKKVTQTELEDFLAETLARVPDETAKNYANKLTHYSDPAKNEIAAMTAKALDGRWRWTYEPAAALQLKPMFGGGPS